MVLPDSHEVSRASQYSGTGLAAVRFQIRGCHPLWPSFPAVFSCLITDPFCRPYNPGVQVLRFGLIPVRSPLLGESRLISSPAGTEMFHFPAFAPVRLCIQRTVTGHYSRRVSPFRYPRIKGCLAPPRGLSQPTTSFIAF